MKAVATNSTLGTCTSIGLPHPRTATKEDIKILTTLQKITNHVSKYVTIRFPVPRKE
eukprot:m.1639502 g.1639502  ORF g.1639502 m.1639502 type:complete len:57 (+) comp35969_c0_seq1:195-365(+)